MLDGISKFPETLRCTGCMREKCALFTSECTRLMREKGAWLTQGCTGCVRDKCV